MLTLKRLAAAFLITITALLAGAVPVFAIQNQAVTQGYGADSQLQKGMIVKLKDKQSNMVEPVTAATVTDMQGVVVAANAAPVTLGNDNNNGQVFVATFGRYDVLVSNQNGPIRTGNYITISSLAGIGMKADSSQPTILGKAAGNFDGTSNVAGTVQLTDEAGHKVSVALGRIPVDVTISHNPLQDQGSNNLPGALRRASQLIANKPVAPVRVYIALALLVITTVIAAIVLYAGIRSSLTAIGRNPLAKRSITRNLFQVILAGVIILLVGVFAVYLILKV